LHGGCLVVPLVSGVTDVRFAEHELVAYVSHVAAFLIALLFIAAGVWKITSPFTWSRMLEELLVPYQLSLPFTLLLGPLEAFAGVTILVPRFRRWGAALSAVLLLAFMVYIGVNYNSLLGKDCSCFPWVKRSVGPAFFAEDAAMLLLALVAGWWTRPPRGLRNAAVILGAVAVFTAVSYGAAVTHQTGAKAPDSITLDGKPFSLQHGRVFVFFYDPTCSHCDAAARQMSKFNWKSDVTRVGIPTNDPQWAASFTKDTGFSLQTSNDLKEMKQIFPFGDPPYGVTIENGRQTGVVSHYDGPAEPAETLRKLGYIE